MKKTLPQQNVVTKKNLLQKLVLHLVVYQAALKQLLAENKVLSQVLLKKKWKH
jgi:hypothetical protein